MSLTLLCPIRQGVVFIGLLSATVLAPSMSRAASPGTTRPGPDRPQYFRRGVRPLRQLAQLAAAWQTSDADGLIDAALQLPKVSGS